MKARRVREDFCTVRHYRRLRHCAYGYHDYYLGGESEMNFDVGWFICVIVVGIICFHAGRNLFKNGK